MLVLSGVRGGTGRQYNSGSALLGVASCCFIALRTEPSHGVLPAWAFYCPGVRRQLVAVTCAGPGLGALRLVLCTAGWENWVQLPSSTAGVPLPSQSGLGAVQNHGIQLPRQGEPSNIGTRHQGDGCAAIRGVTAAQAAARGSRRRTSWCGHPCCHSFTAPALRLTDLLFWHRQWRVTLQDPAVLALIPPDTPSRGIVARTARGGLAATREGQRAGYT